MFEIIDFALQLFQIINIKLYIFKMKEAVDKPKNPVNENTKATG